MATMDTAPLRRKDTTKGPPLRILSLDGGGVRGYSMLIILQELMYRTYVECEGKAPRREEIPKPCDHFDLIVGTGTGGLIAIMLGRLRLDLETCKETYVRMTRRVFETDKTIAGIPYRSTLFKASKLEEAIKQCVREHTLSEWEGNDMTPNGGREVPRAVGAVHPLAQTPGQRPRRTLSRSSVSSMSTIPSSPPSSGRNSQIVPGLLWGNPDASLYDNREFRTKTAVTAVYKGTPRNGGSVLLRSYDARREPPPEFDCTIWQAGRATSATGLAFKPIQIGQYVFVDEGAGTYNPAPQALEEAINEWPGREIGVFVSIGTGKRPPGTTNQQHEWWEAFVGDALGTFAEARRRLMQKIEMCEEIHQKMMKEILASQGVKNENYYRLNVEVGVGEFGMNEWNRLSDISTSTRQYLAKTNVQALTLEAAIKMAQINRQHRHRNIPNVAVTSASSIDDKPTGPPLPPLPTEYKKPPPPAPPLAFELAAEEVPVDFREDHHHPSYQKPPNASWVSEDKFTMIGPDALPAHPTPNDALGTHPARTSGDIPSSRTSYELPYSTPPQHSSPRRSGEGFGGRPEAPPIPPKTAIPYPDDNVGAGGNISMPLPTQQPGPPPVVNKNRKPTYNVRSS